MNTASIIVLIAAAAGITAACVSLHRQKKKGHCCGGCTGDCASCGMKHKDK